MLTIPFLVYFILKSGILLKYFSPNTQEPHQQPRPPPFCVCLSTQLAPLTNPGMFSAYTRGQAPFPGNR